MKLSLRIGLIVLSTVLLAACSTYLEKMPEKDIPPAQETFDAEPEVQPEISDAIEVEESVQYIVAKPQTLGYMAKPKGEGPFPALILIHEWWGLNEDIREKAREFAEEGYVAFAVDLYDGRNSDSPDGARLLSSEVRDNMDNAFANLNAAVMYLKNRGDVEEARMASVGWCFGGGWSYEMAKNDLGVAASVIYYGRFNPEDDLAQMRAKILGHFGETDRSILVDDVKAFQANLKTLNGEHQVFIYSNAGHGFANPDNDNYDLESAETAYQRTLEFLESQL